MNVLIIGNADSIWIKKIIERTLLPYGDAVSVFTPTNKEYVEFYKEHRVDIFTWKKRGTSRNTIKHAGCLFRKYDVTVVFYPCRQSALMGKINRPFTKRLILSFLGSDILRAASPDRTVMSALGKANCITITTPEMKEKFQSVYGHAFDTKIIRTGFGANGFEALDAVLERADSLRKEYDIPEDKVVVSVGYNKMVNQQHMKALEAIATLSEELRSKMHLILRLTYGDGDAEYVAGIKNLVSQLGCSCSYYESFLSDEKFAELTCLTDIFVHAQTSDAKSASMCEHLYAGCIVLNPSWIEYSDLKDRIYDLKFADFDDLGLMLKENLVRKENYPDKDKLCANKQAIRELCSWDSYVPMWRAAYMGVDE